MSVIGHLRPVIVAAAAAAALAAATTAAAATAAAAECDRRQVPRPSIQPPTGYGLN